MYLDFFLYSYQLPIGEFLDNTNGLSVYLWKTSAVGSYMPNAWGLYDMHGNVWEWCLDYCGSPLADYGSAAVENPLVTTGSRRVLRGGGWAYYARLCRSASRSSGPDAASIDNGFRVVFVP